MSIELQKDKHREAIASIVRYFQEQREEKIGNIAATSLEAVLKVPVGYLPTPLRPLI